MSGNSVSGAASGSFRDVDLQLSIVVGADESGAMATGLLRTGSVGGTIDGQVAIGGFGCSNNGHSWTLVPR